MTVPKGKTRFRFVGQHLDDLADGRVLEPGSFIDLTTVEAVDPHNAQRIADGLLIEAPANKKESD